jgi:glycosyltransferase involved in cell wall biosynthesis
MKNFKFLIILFYYNRPNLVKNSLYSLKNSTYKNWELHFIDDGSDINGKDLVCGIFDDTSNITFYNSFDTLEDKIKRRGYQGSNMGKYAQESINKSTSDYGLFLCDDDMLIPNYLENLNKFYNLNPNKNYSYCHIKIYDPKKEIPSEPFKKISYKQNITKNTNPYYVLDISQVSFNVEEYKKENIRFPYPLTVNIDAEVFIQMYNKWGSIEYNGIDGQFKAIYDDNLMVRSGRVVGGHESEDFVYKIKVQ